MGAFRLEKELVLRWKRREGLGPKKKQEKIAQIRHAG